jgi:hypothetical protein
MGMATMAAFSVQGACGLSVNQSSVSDCRDAGIWIRTRRDIGMRSRSSSSRRELEDGKQRCLFTRRIGGCGGIRCVASEPKVKTSVDDNEGMEDNSLFLLSILFFIFVFVSGLPSVFLKSE